VALACLLDSLDAVAAVPDVRHVLVLEGEEGSWIPPDFEVIHQRGDGLAERLIAAFTDVDTNAILIAMDTPQVTPALLTSALAALGHSDAVYGPAADGGYWLIGLRRSVSPHTVFDGIPMSEPTTGAAQLARLASLGLSTECLETLTDIDVIDDLVAVSRLCEGSRLATVAAAIATRLETVDSRHRHDRNR
jgi:uncharacterized protein